MASELVFKWEIVRGISPLMVSNFFHAVFFSESELDLDGFIQMVIDGKRDAGGISLQRFASEHIVEFRDYIAEVTGDAMNASTSSKSSVLQFIRDRGLISEYHSFIASHASEWSDSHDKNEIRDSLVSEKIMPLFNDLQKNDIYVYRDSDHCGIHASRKLVEQ
jgi:hypothetical protein